MEKPHGSSRLGQTRTEMASGGWGANPSLERQMASKPKYIQGGDSGKFWP